MLNLFVWTCYHLAPFLLGFFGLAAVLALIADAIIR